MFVLGTAGHIDHGKSVLVRALTGIDPDRLHEERERGMTIDLGFAWLKLPSGSEVGIVDVPGHERFVKNMLAGVGSIDLALLIIAANEGVMPQTKEHLAILDLLGIERGVVVVTKKDLVDEELLSLVRMEIEELIGTTSVSQAPVMAVSALTGEGLPELIGTIDELLESTDSKRDLGRPRLPIDRVFTMAGSGTVVTGTLVDGSLSVGQEVEIVPAGLKSRLRGLQTHKARIEKAEPGSRVAANLVGINKSQIQRGDVVTNPGWLKTTRMLTVKLSLISYLQRPLRHGTMVSFHTGAAEAMAKVSLLEGDDLKPGMSTWAQVRLFQHVAVVEGDRFIIRSPMETLGGGDIVDAHAKRLRRLRPEVIRNLEARKEGTAEEAILAFLETKQPQEISALVSQSNYPADEVEAVTESLVRQGRIVEMKEGKHQVLLTSAGWEHLKESISKILADYHKRFPLRSGMPKVELSSRMKLGNYSSMALTMLVGHSVLIEDGGKIRLPGHSVQPSVEQQRSIDIFLNNLARNPYNPSTETIPETDLLNWLGEQGRIVKVSESIVFSSTAYIEMVKKIKAHIEENGRVSLAEVRDMFQTSRKYAQALLEHLDAEKVTRRVGDERVLY